jgi:transcriptional regulator
MYVPPLFAMDKDEELLSFCQAFPFAALITAGADGLFATHLPLVLKRGEAGSGNAFFGHLARANPHWQRVPDGSEALLIFSGPQAYVTPSWYATKKETAKVVPTWNYAVVHARGRVSWPADAAFLRENLADLTDQHEAKFEHRWALSDAPDDFVAMQMRAIVGMRFEITALEGKVKMSQNRPAADVDGVVEGLAGRADPMDREVGRWVEKNRRR